MNDVISWYTVDCLINTHLAVYVNNMQLTTFYKFPIYKEMVIKLILMHVCMHIPIYQSFIKDFLFGGKVFNHASTKHVNACRGVWGHPPPRKCFNVASLRLILVPF